MTETYDAIIIGGGIVGAASAFFLARAGLRCVIVERLPALARLTTSRSMEAMRAQFVEPENVTMMATPTTTDLIWIGIIARKLPNYQTNNYSQVHQRKQEYPADAANRPFQDIHCAPPRKR